MNAINDNIASLVSRLRDTPSFGNEEIAMGTAKDIDPSRPVNLVSAAVDNFDATEVYLGNAEFFEVRQTDDDGQCRIVLMSRDMVMEMMKLMNTWVSLG